MGSKSALKKLMKKSQKVSSRSLKQLNSLAANNDKKQHISPNLAAELNQLSYKVIGNVVQELTPPLSPILSWLNDGIAVNQARGSIRPAIQPATDANLPAVTSIKMMPKKSVSILQIPLKSPPCKRCPAKMGGNCKCAAKKLNINL
ncbi:hypothetical protein [Shewanella sairae]|uniref:hypothetical protein n=1 Tax=Shewanella sairae TaxID=190310 RepID=UPI001C809D35|nr:hypothetical protein [Shewanella sairae]MCL1128700.1 hypothetical protein [Shewanella sairae]